MAETLEECLKLWTEKILRSKRKEISPGELSSLFQQQELSQAFFRIIDRDRNGSITLEEWTGCFSKILGETEELSMKWFVDKFNTYCTINDTLYLNENDFYMMANEIEFGYRFASIVSPKSRRVNTLQLITSLEILASMSTDSKWLSWLKFQFTDAMIKSNRYNNNELYVTLDDFIENFNFKEPFLAERLFSYLDKDKSGTLTLHEFINGLEVVVNGNQQEKMEFLFKVFDVDNDGHLDYEELRMMLKCCLEDSPSLNIEETVDDLAAVLFKDMDHDDSGDITLEELKEAFKKYESLFKTLTVSTSIWIKPKFIKVPHKKKLYQKMKEIVVNKRALTIFWTSYVVINIACMVSAFLTYFGESPYYIIARMFGNSLNFNCSLILVLALRKHLTWLREKGAGFFMPIDDSIEIHKQVGFIILGETLLHTLAHMIHLYEECEAKTECSNFWIGLFTPKLSLGYPTGIIDFVLLFVIILFAMPFVRNKGYFQLFYWFHMLTIPWLIIMVLHSKVFWRWLLLPMFCYMVEKILRYRKVSSNKFGDTIITEACVLPSKVTHLVIRKPPKFHFKPGDYIYINIPIVAKYEWHPFSISSAPENSEFLWLHIKTCGNWTRRLYNYSSSTHFDANNSNANSSNIRCNMRTRMSINIINDSNLFPKLSIMNKMRSETKSNESELELMKLAKKEACKKIVSFSNQKQLKESWQFSNALMENTESNNHFPPQQNFAKLEDINEEDNQVPVAAPIRHKGILKVAHDNVQNSFLNKSNESHISSGTGNDNASANSPSSQQSEMPTESTPVKTDQNSNRRLASSQDIECCQKSGFDPDSCLESRTRSKSVNDLSKEINEDEINACSNKITENLNGLNLETNKSKRHELSFNEESIITSNVKEENSFEIKSSENDYGINKDSDTVSKNCNTKNQNHVIININDDAQRTEKNKPNKGELIEKKVTHDRRFSEALNFKDDNILGYMKMYRKYCKVSENTIGIDDMWRLKVYIDGPYGTPSQSIFDSEHAVLVAAGIGITPFASILQSLMNQYKRAKASCPNCQYKIGEELMCMGEKLSVKKVDFIWITREQRSLEWFISMLSQMEIEQAKCQDTFLETHLYVTSARRQSDLRTIGLHLTLDAICSKEESKLIDGLKKRTHFGRPNWDIVLQQLIRKQKGKINMFYCGPPNLSNVLQNKCNEYNIVFKKEIF